jgi:signal transduction histidine kinase
LAVIPPGQREAGAYPGMTGLPPRPPPHPDQVPLPPSHRHQLAGYLRPSLRRRVAVATAAMFVLGYVVVAAALNVVLRLWYSFHWFNDHGPTFTPGLFSGSVYAGPFSTRTQVLIVVFFLPALLLAGWAWWIAAGGLLRPVSATAQAVRQLGPQNLGQRIRMGGGADDPLKKLADALDEALDRLAAGYEGQRRFAANASHELRTPLAVQRLLTEVALDDPQATGDLRRLGAHLLRANERNERLIEGLLVLAEADRGLPGTVPLRLDELAGSVIDSHQDMAAKHGVALRRTLTERVVPGDPLLLERLLANLVGNAIRYNQPGGWVEVEVIPQDRAALTVSNTGQYVSAPRSRRSPRAAACPSSWSSTCPSGQQPRSRPSPTCARPSCSPTSPSTVAPSTPRWRPCTCQAATGAGQRRRRRGARASRRGAAWPGWPSGCGR